MISMMETCLLMAPFLKGQKCCLRGLSPHPTLPALGSQVNNNLIWSITPCGPMLVGFVLRHRYYTDLKLDHPLYRSGPPSGSAAHHRQSNVTGRADAL